HGEGKTRRRAASGFSACSCLAQKFFPRSIAMTLHKAALLNSVAGARSSAPRPSPQKVIFRRMGGLPVVHARRDKPLRPRLFFLRMFQVLLLLSLVCLAPWLLGGR